MSPPPAGSAKPLPVWATFVSSAIAACTGEVRITSCLSRLLERACTCRLTIFLHMADCHSALGYRKGTPTTTSQVRRSAQIQVRLQSTPRTPQQGHRQPDSCILSRGLIGTVGTVAREEGVYALWKGLEPGALAVYPFAGSTMNA